MPEEKTEVLRKASLNPKLDWICDGCGKKIYGRRKVPAVRCHGYPLRPMGSPWKWVTEAFYERYKAGTGEGSKLPDDYWISDRVIVRLTEVVAERSLKWSGSVRSKHGYEHSTYDRIP